MSIIEDNVAYNLTEVVGKLGSEIQLRIASGVSSIQLTPYAADVLAYQLIGWAENVRDNLDVREGGQK